MADNCKLLSVNPGLIVFLSRLSNQRAYEEFVIYGLVVRVYHPITKQDKMSLVFFSFVTP